MLKDEISKLSEKFPRQQLNQQPFKYCTNAVSTETLVQLLCTQLSQTAVFHCCQVCARLSFTYSQGGHPDIIPPCPLHMLNVSFISLLIFHKNQHTLVKDVKLLVKTQRLFFVRIIYTLCTTFSIFKLKHANLLM